MTKLLTLLKKEWKIFVLIAVSLLVRIYFVDKFVDISGDLLVHKEWGERYWQIGPRNFYFDEDWYYSKPTQPPITSLIFANAYYLYDHRYRLAELHNIIKFPPAPFIIYFGDWGYEMMLKMPGILGDILLGGLIYKYIFKITGRKRSALFGIGLYLFNPVTIFLSGVWGQTESLIAFFGLLSFYLLTTKYIWMSPFFMFLSLYTKPTWAVFIPLYVFCLIFLWIKKKLKPRDLFFGITLTALALIIVTKPFSGNNIISFTKYITLNNMLPAAKGTIKATSSAFNFHSIIFDLDVNLSSDPYLFMPANYLGYFILAYIYLMVFSYLRKKGLDLKTITVSGGVVGFGSALFLTGMLERYLFLGFPFIAVLAMSDKKLFKYFVIFTATLFSNLIWAFYRRRFGKIDHLFTDYGLFLVRVISFINVLTYVLFVRSNIGKNLLKLRLWKK